MTEQPELDLPPPADPAGQRRAARREGFGGFTRAQLVLGALLVAVLTWSMWVTKTLVAPRSEHIVKARLSSIVGDYVAAQARSASPPGQVEAEMRVFMASLDRELQQRSARGQVVLVGEAVLTGNVPDITDSLAKAVYASGVRTPRPASAEDLQRLQRPVAPVGIVPQAPAAAIAPPPGVGFDPGAAAGVPSATAVVPQTTPGAAIATFGGSDGNGSR